MGQNRSRERQYFALTSEEGNKESLLMNRGTSIRGRVAIALLSLCALSLLAPFATAKPPVLFHPGLKNSVNYAPYPAHTANYITDLADLLTPAEEQPLEAWLTRTEQKTGAEIAVVTIDSLQQYPGTDNGSMENFARALLNTYHLGNFPRHEGVLVLVCKQDRNAHIVLTDSYSYSSAENALRIRDEVLIPAIQKGHYGHGISTAVYDLTRDLGGLNTWSAKLLGTVPLILGVIAIAAIVISLVRNGKHGWGWVIVGAILVVILFALRIVFAVFYWIPSGPRLRIPNVSTIGSVSSQVGDGSPSKNRNSRTGGSTRGSW